VSDASDICVRLRAEVVWEPDVGELLGEAASEIERLRLTDEEREAIAEAAGAYNDNDDDEECAKIAATLHGILKRLG
jgi:hypothetical protein